jgi:predicted transcriptional regulator
MALKRQLKEVNKELEKWVTMVPVNWIGKWGRSVRITQLTKERDSILNQIEINKLKANEEK